MSLTGDEAQPTSIELKEAIAFWQKEAHYYEGRAGEQGAAAGRIVAITGGAIAAVGVVATTATIPSRSLFLLLVPVVVLLLWSTAIRLLHEMSILRTYREHAEYRLTRLVGSSDDLRAYRTWKGDGGRYDAPAVITTVWFAMAAILSLAGTFGVLLLLWGRLSGWEGVVLGAMLLVVACLGFAYWTNEKHAEEVRKVLGFPALPKRKLRTPPRNQFIW